MGKDLKGKDLGVDITQQKNGLYNSIKILIFIIKM